MKIAKATMLDAEMILGIQQIAYLDEVKRYKNTTVPPISETLKSIVNEFRTHTFLKAEIDSMIVGSIRGVEKGNVCYLGRLTVLPRYDNQGVGSALLQEIEKCYTKVRRFELFTSSNSEENLHFYKKNGYTEYKLEPLNDEITFVYLEKFCNK